VKGPKGREEGEVTEGVQVIVQGRLIRGQPQARGWLGSPGGAPRREVTEERGASYCKKE